MKERTISAGGQVKIKSTDGADGYLLPAAGFYFSHLMNLALEAKERDTKINNRWSWRAPPLQTCAGSGGDLGGSPARSPLSLVAVHNGVSLTALPPKLHRKVTPHLDRRQRLKHFNKPQKKKQDVIPSQVIMSWYNMTIWLQGNNQRWWTTTKESHSDACLIYAPHPDPGSLRKLVNTHSLRNIQ